MRPEKIQAFFQGLIRGFFPHAQPAGATYVKAVSPLRLVAFATECQEILEARCNTNARNF